MERVRSDDPLVWLASQDGGDSICGYDPSGWERSVWILNPFYETASLPSGLSHDEVRRIEEAAGTAEPRPDCIPAELMERAVLTGGGLGWSAHPGSGWERIPWVEMGRRLDVDPFAARWLDAGAFRRPSWPVNIQPPTEGSLDVEQYRRLVEHLSTATPGMDCFAYYAELTASALVDERFVQGAVLYRGRIDDLDLFSDDAIFDGSPSNIWSVDGSWFVYTDWDLWATKVSGTAALIDGLIADHELETVELGSGGRINW